jgi:hypothetical protein
MYLNIRRFLVVSKTRRFEMRKLKILLLISFCFIFVMSAIAAEYDFADPTALGANNSAKGWKVISGTWAIEDGMYVESDTVGQAAAQDGNAFRSIYQSSWMIKDGTVEMKAKHDAKSSGANDAILLYRMENEEKGYATRLQRDGFLTIGKITGGIYAHLKYTATPVNADTVYTVTVELDGTAIDAYLDDKLLVTVDDATYKEGKIGLCVGRSASPIYFLSVSAEGDGIPKGSMTPVESPGKLATTWGLVKR